MELLFERHEHQPVPCHFPPHLLNSETVALAALVLTLFALCPEYRDENEHPPHSVHRLELVGSPIQIAGGGSAGDLSIEVGSGVLKLTGLAPTVLIAAA